MSTTEAMAISHSFAPVGELCRRAVAFSAPSKPGTVSHIRRRVRRFARSMNFTQIDLDDISIAVGEAATNALRHGYDPDHAFIGIRIEDRVNSLRVSISDSGPGFDPASVCPPCPGELREGGRGIMCMRALMDDVQFTNLNPGTQVDMLKFVADERCGVR